MEDINKEFSSELVTITKFTSFGNFLRVYGYKTANENLFDYINTKITNALKQKEGTKSYAGIDDVTGDMCIVNDNGKYKRAIPLNRTLDTNKILVQLVDHGDFKFYDLSNILLNNKVVAADKNDPPPLALSFLIKDVYGRWDDGIIKKLSILINKPFSVTYCYEVEGYKFANMVHNFDFSSYLSNYGWVINEEKTTEMFYKNLCILRHRTLTNGTGIADKTVVFCNCNESQIDLKLGLRCDYDDKEDEFETSLTSIALNIPHELRNETFKRTELEIGKMYKVFCTDLSELEKFAVKFVDKYQKVYSLEYKALHTYSPLLLMNNVPIPINQSCIVKARNQRFRAIVKNVINNAKQSYCEVEYIDHGIIEYASNMDIYRVPDDDEFFNVTSGAVRCTLSNLDMINYIYSSCVYHWHDCQTMLLQREFYIKVISLSEDICECELFDFQKNRFFDYIYPGYRYLTRETLHENDSIIICYTKTSEHFYIRKSDSLSQIYQTIYALDQLIKLPLHKYFLGAACICQNEHNMWCRAKIIEMDSNKEDIRVLCVDYGYEFVKKRTELFRITYDLLVKMPPQAIPCRINTKLDYFILQNDMYFYIDVLPCIKSSISFKVNLINKLEKADSSSPPSNENKQNVLETELDVVMGYLKCSGRNDYIIGVAD